MTPPRGAKWHGRHNCKCDHNKVQRESNPSSSRSASPAGTVRDPGRFTTARRLAQRGPPGVHKNANTAQRSSGKPLCTVAAHTHRWSQLAAGQVATPVGTSPPQVVWYPATRHGRSFYWSVSLRTPEPFSDSGLTSLQSADVHPPNKG